MNCLHPIHIYDSVFQCRHCQCCVVERANSIKNRIMNELDSKFMPIGWLTYFVTLTYDNWSLPYVTLSDLNNGNAIIRRGITRDYMNNSVSENKIVDDKSNYSSKWYSSIDISQYKSSAYIIKKGTGKKYPALYDCVGVLYMRDFQLFFKRLNKLLSNNYGYSKFRFFCSYEYGENTYRPHCHILLSSPIPQKVLKNTIIKAWPYCDFAELDRQLSRFVFDGHRRSWFETALRPAKYVSTYVCDGFNLPPFYKLPIWRQKKSHSLYYGFNNPSFSLRSLYDAIRAQNLEYTREYFSKDGQYHVDRVLIPSYVLYRFFPKIKRYSWLAHDVFVRLCESISRNFTKYRQFSGSSVCLSRKELLDGYIVFQQKDLDVFYIDLQYSDEDILNFINICWRMFHFARELGILFYDYLLLYDSVYRLLSSVHLKRLHDEDFNFLSSFRYYTNINFLLTKIGDSSASSDLIFSDSFGVVQTSRVLDFCQSWKDPNQAVLLRQFADNKNIKKANAGLNPFYNLIAYGT